MTHSFPTRRCSDLGSRAGRHLGGRGRRRRPLTRPGEATEWSVLDAGGENRGMPSPQVSLVVTDLDGTLWHHDDHIDPEVVAAIGKLEDLGVPLLVATGRRLASTRGPLARIGVAPPAVVLNGALGVDLATDERFHRAPYPRDEAIEVLAAFQSVGLDPAVYVDHRSEEPTSELPSLMRISYAVCCLKTKKNYRHNNRL